MAVTGRLRGPTAHSRRGGALHPSVSDPTTTRSLLAPIFIKLSGKLPPYVLNLKCSHPPLPFHPQRAAGHVDLKSIHQHPRLQVPAARDLEKFPAPYIFQYHLNDHGHNPLKGNEPLTYETHCISTVPQHENTHVGKQTFL